MGSRERDRWGVLGSGLPGPARSGLDRYMEELLRWNRSIRLVGPKDRDGVVLQIVDSLLPFVHVEPAFPLLDVGSGAGLPGIALALIHRDRPVVCLEPRNKRAAFLRHCVRALGLQRVEVVQARSDSVLENRSDLAGAVDTVTARAVAADVPGFLREVYPFLAECGQVVLPRGGGGPPEPVAGWSGEGHRYPAPKPLGERSVWVFRPNRPAHRFT